MPWVMQACGGDDDAGGGGSGGSGATAAGGSGTTAAGGSGTTAKAAVRAPAAERAPTPLKVLAPNLLVTAESANDGGGVSLIWMDGTSADIEEVVSGFDQVATFALHQASAWLVENQGDHFWGGDGTETKPFRLVEVPLNLP